MFLRPRDLNIPFSSVDINTADQYRLGSERDSPSLQVGGAAIPGISSQCAEGVVSQSFGYPQWDHGLVLVDCSLYA
jgi:hypothetical protein